MRETPTLPPAEGPDAPRPSADLELRLDEMEEQHRELARRVLVLSRRLDSLGTARR